MQKHLCIDIDDAVWKRLREYHKVIQSKETTKRKSTIGKFLGVLMTDFLLENLQEIETNVAQAKRESIHATIRRAAFTDGELSVLEVPHLRRVHRTRKQHG